MTFQNARKRNPGDMIQPKSETKNVLIESVRISMDDKTLYFTCDNGQTYSHRDVNPPIMTIIENGMVTYSMKPRT